MISWLEKFNFRLARGSRGQMEIGTILIGAASLSMMAMASLWVNNIIKQSGKTKNRADISKILNYVSNAAYISETCKAGFNDPANIFSLPTGTPPTVNFGAGFQGLIFKVMNPSNPTAVLFQQGQTWNGLTINKLKIETANMSPVAADYTLSIPATATAPLRTKAMMMKMTIGATLVADNTVLPETDLTFLISFEDDGTGKRKVSDCTSSGTPSGSLAQSSTFQDSTSQAAASQAAQAACAKLEFTWNPVTKICTPKATTANKICTLFKDSTLQGTACRVPAGTGGGTGGGTPPAADKLTVTIKRQGAGADLMGIWGNFGPNCPPNEPSGQDGGVGCNNEYELQAKIELTTTKSVQGVVLYTSGGYYGTYQFGPAKTEFPPAASMGPEYGLGVKGGCNPAYNGCVSYYMTSVYSNSLSALFNAGTYYWTVHANPYAGNVTQCTGANCTLRIIFSDGTDLKKDF